MSTPSDLEPRLVAALRDTGRRNLPDAVPVPTFQPNRVVEQSTGRIRNWALPVLAAAVVVAVAVALILPNRKHYSSLPPAHGPGTLITLRAHTGKPSLAELKQARQVIRARAVALGAKDPDVRIVGQDEIAAFLPEVSAADVGQLGMVDAYQVRPFIINWTLAPKWPISVPVIPDPPVIDQWKSLGFTPPKDSAGYWALSKDQQDAIRAVITHWNCSDKPLNRPEQPIVACDALANKYLLGPVILTGDDIQSSVVVQMGPATAARHSAITINLSTTGQLRWAAYRTQHPWPVSPHDVSNGVADLLDDSVAVSYNTQSSLKGDLQLPSDTTTRKVGPGLAANLTGGALPAQFDLVSVRGN